MSRCLSSAPGIVIAIDGPSGSGKSSVSREVARRLGLHYLDTGAMYRALTWWVSEQAIDLSDHSRLGEAARTFPLELSLDPDERHVRVGGTDVTEDIRGEVVTSAVSAVAADPRVRRGLIETQRRLMDDSRVNGTGIVAEGRDITTVVARDADVRVLLTASAAERQRRRLAEAGEATASTMAARDAADAKVNEFMTAAPGVSLVDTTSLGFDEVVEEVLRLVDAARE